MATKYYDSRSIVQVKLDTVENFQFFLSERLNGINADNFKEEFEKLSLEFHKSIEDEYDAAVAKHKAQTRPAHTVRQPTAYNTFIKNTMERLKAENPTMNNVGLMTMAATAWNVHKIANTTTPITPANTVAAPSVSVPHPPTTYNMFIKNTMERLKTENPEMKNTDLMTAAAVAWAERKGTL